MPRRGSRKFRQGWGGGGKNVLVINIQRVIRIRGVQLLLDGDPYEYPE